jgi:hypothetical protein
MAFGDKLASSGNAGSAIPASISPTAAVTVAAGNLAVVALSERATFTGTTCTDDLGNTWNDLAGLDGGTPTIKAWYSIITNAGSMTPTVAATSSSADYGLSCVIYEGPFAASPLDQNPTPLADSTTPHTSNLSGTLAQADELRVGYIGSSNGGVYTSPDQQNGSGTGANTTSVGIFHDVVSSTTSAAISIPSSITTTSLVGIATFKKGSANKTLTIDSGSYAVTGQDVSLAHGWVVAVDGASYSISGQDVTLAKGLTVSVDAGSYAVTGQDVSLTKTWLLGVDSGSYAITGQDVALSRDLPLAVDAGSYSIAGQDVTLSHGWAVSVDAGSYSISGQDVTLTKTWLLNVDAGSYAVTGQDVELTKAASLSIAVDAGSYSITGQDVTLAHGWAVSVDAGSYSITGQDVALSVGFAVAVDAGSYSVAGQDVTLTKIGALTIDVDAGSYAISGQDVALAHQWAMDVDSGGYLLTGQDVELTHGAAPAASTRGYHDPGFWTEEHRKIKEREEGVPESIEALSNLPAFIAPPKTWGDADEQDELDELLELMEIMDHDSI